jgi:hypothetical protein
MAPICRSALRDLRCGEQAPLAPTGHWVALANSSKDAGAAAWILCDFPPRPRLPSLRLRAGGVRPQAGKLGGFVRGLRLHHRDRATVSAHAHQFGEGCGRMRLFSGAVFVGLAFVGVSTSQTGDDPPFSTAPVSVPDINIAPEGLPELEAVEVGHHDAFDRVVFRFSSHVPGYNVNYVPEVRADPSDEPIPLEGNAFMIVAMHSVASGQVGAPPAPQDRQTPRSPELSLHRAPGRCCTGPCSRAGCGWWREVGALGGSAVFPGRVADL